MSDNSTHTTPLVRKLAAENNIDLATIAGTGVGGRITASDVRARLPRKADAIVPTRPVSLPGSRRLIVEVRSTWGSGKRVQVDAFARNPLVQDAEQSVPELVSAARGEGAPTPTLFMAGDLPIMMASGMDPELLLQLPWQVRHAAAGADSMTLAKLLETFSDGEGPVKAAYEHAGHAGNREYYDRVHRWLSGLTPEAETARAREREEAMRARSEGRPAPAADPRVYEAMFGAQEAERERERLLRAAKKRIREQAQRDLDAATARHTQPRH